MIVPKGWLCQKIKRFPPKVNHPESFRDKKDYKIGRSRSKSGFIKKENNTILKLQKMYYLCFTPDSSGAKH